jgi:hypothetical protein
MIAPTSTVARASRSAISGSAGFSAMRERSRE